MTTTPMRPNQWTNVSCRCLMALALSGMFLSAAWAGPAVYTFEGLATGTLSGQDGWTGATGLQVEPGSVAPDTSLVVTSAVAGSVVRDAGGSFTWDKYSSSDTQAEYVLDVRPGDETNVGVLMSLGTTAAKGFSFGVWGSKFALGTAGQAFGSVFANQSFGSNSWNLGLNTDWYRVRLLIDFTANGGAGAASMAYMDMTTGDTAFLTDGMTALQNVNLNLLSLSSVDRNPANWSRMTLRMQVGTGTGVLPEVDALTPYAVPEPSALALLCLAGVAAASRRRRFA